MNEFVFSLFFHSLSKNYLQVVLTSVSSVRHNEIILKLLSNLPLFIQQINGINRCIMSKNLFFPLELTTVMAYIERVSRWICQWLIFETCFSLLVFLIFLAMKYIKDNQEQIDIVIISNSN